MNIFKSAKELFNSTTGFKSKCVAYSYVAFTTVIMVVLGSVIILFIYGTVSNTAIVYVEAIKEVFIPIIKVAAGFFGVAVGFVFGAQAVTKNDKTSNNAPNNAPVEAAP